MSPYSDFEQSIENLCERRKEQRYPIHLPLRVRITVEGKEVFLDDSMLQNISNFGMLLLLNKNIPVTSNVVIDLNPTESAICRQVTGKVVRLENVDSKEKAAVALQLNERLNLSFAEALEKLKPI